MVRRSRNNSRDCNSNERGTVAIMVAIMLVMLLGFASFVVDVGYIFRTRGELQNAVDSAALAGAMELDGTGGGLQRACDQVNAFAQSHRADNYSVALRAEDIQLGHWYFETATGNLPCTPPCFNPVGGNCSNHDDSTASSINAVRVLGARNTAHSSQLKLFFGAFVGSPQADVGADAIAVGGGPSEESCGFPMVVAECALLNEADEHNICDYCMKMQDDTDDNAGWTSFSPNGAVGGPEIAGLVESMCIRPDGTVNIDEATGRCQGGCNSSGLDDEIQVKNGVGFNDGNKKIPGNNNVCAVIKHILTRGVEGGPASPFVVSVPVIGGNYSSGSCASDFKGKQTIVGFAKMTIYGARCTNSGAEVLAPGAPVCSNLSAGEWPPPSEKYIIAALDCDHNTEAPAGSGFFGVDAKHVRLVE